MPVLLLVTALAVPAAAQAGGGGSQSPAQAQYSAAPVVVPSQSGPSSPSPAVTSSPSSAVKAAQAPKQRAAPFQPPAAQPAAVQPAAASAGQGPTLPFTGLSLVKVVLAGLALVALGLLLRLRGIGQVERQRR